MEQIHIIVLSNILENKELTSLEKVILSLGYSYSIKKGYNLLTNVELGELLCMNENTIGKSRKSLIEKGYETKEKSKPYKYYITDKYKETKPKDKRDLIILPEVYSKNITVGSKLLWAEYNSLSNKGKGESFAKREYLAERLNCSLDSITNWYNELIENELISDTKLLGGAGKRQRRVKTVDFTKGSNSTILVSLDKRKEIWNEYIGDKATLRKAIQTEKDVWEFCKELYGNINGSDNKREIVSSLFHDLNNNKLKGSKILEFLSDNINKVIQTIEY